MLNTDLPLLAPGNLNLALQRYNTETGCVGPCHEHTDFYFK
jgi:hypothetical protein